MFQQAERYEGAVACYRQLQRQFADVVCRDGKTGKQLVAALPPAGPVAGLLKPETAWPLGKVEISKAAPPPPQQINYYNTFAVQFQNDPAPFFSGTTLRFDQGQQAIVGYDGFGKQRWTAPLTEKGQQGVFGYNPAQSGASVYGHLLVLPVGTRIVALDPAGLLAAAGKSSEPPRPLWFQDLNDSSADKVKNLKVKNQPVVQPGGQPPFAVYSPPAVINAIGAITDRYVCFQRFRNLVAVDPLSGEPLWVRRDIPQGSKVFGDEQFVFVLPADASQPGAAQGTAAPQPKPREAMVLRAADGQLLGKRKMPNVFFEGDAAFVQAMMRVGGPVFAAHNVRFMGANAVLGRHVRRVPGRVRPQTPHLAV